MANRSANRAPGLSSAGRGQGLPPLSPHPLLRNQLRPSLRFGQVSLDEAEHFLHNRCTSVATLRWCSGSSRNAVRLPFGISVRLRRNPHSKRAMAKELVEVRAKLSFSTVPTDRPLTERRRFLSHGLGFSEENRPGVVESGKPVDRRSPIPLADSMHSRWIAIDGNIFPENFGAERTLPEWVMEDGSGAPGKWLSGERLFLRQQNPGPIGLHPTRSGIYETELL
jgi:hypothetical protein